jgi:GTPase SAR1 family protein
MHVSFILGTAGSGKSLLTSSFADWLKMEKQDVIILNLDPAVLNLPYKPDVDIREYIRVNEIMERYGLGPNGALVMAADLIAGEVKDLKEEIENLKPDIVLVDTPGQMELFAFRASGPYIAKELSMDTKAIIYLFDSVFSHNPLNYVSNLFLSTAVYNRFYMPQVHVLSKCDLLSPKEIEKISDWASNIIALEMEIEEKLTGTQRLLSRDMIHAIYELGLNFFLIPISAKNNDGLIDLKAVLERIFTGGEKITP